MPSSNQIIRIASRGSALALVQTNWVMNQCQQALPDHQFETKIIKTTGDKLQATSQASFNLPKGLFTKELEVALLNGEADLAVHSLKDLPTDLPDGLELGAVPVRADVRDVLICRGATAPKSGLSLDGLPANSTIATSSNRRSAQVREKRRTIAIQFPLMRGSIMDALKGQHLSTVQKANATP